MVIERVGKEAPLWHVPQNIQERDEEGRISVRHKQNKLTLEEPVLRCF